MTTGIVLVLIAGLLLIIAIGVKSKNSELSQGKTAIPDALSPEQRADKIANNKAVAEIRRKEQAAKDEERSQRWAYGQVNGAMICPHCQVRGKIRTKTVINKKGVSGGKATAALLTGGVSLLATGLSRKEEATQARCGNCTSLWLF